MPVCILTVFLPQSCSSLPCVCWEHGRTIYSIIHSNSGWVKKEKASFKCHFWLLYLALFSTKCQASHSLSFGFDWFLLLLSLNHHAKVVDALMKDIVPFSFSLHMLIQLNMYMAFTYFIMGHLCLKCVQSPHTLLSHLGSSFRGVVCWFQTLPLSVRL